MRGKKKGMGKGGVQKNGHRTVSPGTRSRTARAPVTTLRILIVEDDRASLKLMSYLVRALGHTALEARDGREGWQVAEQERPDLIVCDIAMPRADGFQVARWRRDHSELHRVPLVAVTAMAMPGDRERILAAGFDAYISKPIAPETFVQQLEALAKAA